MKDFDDLLASEYDFKPTIPIPSATLTSSFDLDSIYDKPPSSYDKPPVYDRPPVYDEDIFEGVPGIKTTSSSSLYSGFGVGYDRDDVTATGKKGKDGDGDGFEELLGVFLGGGKDGKEAGNRSGGERGGGAAFDDLLPGFSVGSGSGSGGTNTAPQERCRFSICQIE